MSIVDSIYEDFRNAVIDGRYLPGTRLPSIREAAASWNCNKVTVKKAYDRLKVAGYIENTVGKGSFVKFPKRFGEQKDPFSFQTASIGEELFPTEETRELTNKLYREVGSSLFAAAPPGGDPACLDALSHFYRIPRDRTVVISGAQQGLDLAGRLLSRPVSESVVFEDPTYSGAINLFRPKHFIPLDKDGPDLDRIEEYAKKGMDAYYAMPQVHNPTGRSYTSTVMEKVAELGEKYNFLIVEDDYLSEFLPDFFERTPTRFLDLIPERTVYIKSLSKVTAPGIRIGLMVVPSELKEELLFSKFNTDIGTSSFMQNIVRAFIAEGILKKSLYSYRRICTERRTRLEKLLDSYPFLSYTSGRPGYNIWVHSEVDPNISDPPWAKGENFSFDPRYKSFFRLSFMSQAEQRFTVGLDYLAEILNGLSRADSPGVF